MDDLSSRAAAFGPWGVWGLLGAMQLMFGVAWLFAARLNRATRQPLRMMAGFNLLCGAGLWLRDLGPAALPIAQGPMLAAVVGVVDLLGGVMLWRCAAGLCGAPDARREQATLVIVGGGLMAWFGGVRADEPQVQALAGLALAWLAARACLQLARRLWAVDARPSALAMLACGLGAAVLLAAPVLPGLAAPAMAAQGLGCSAPWPQAFGRMFSVVPINLILTYRVFGRVVRDLNRLSEHDPLTGLANHDTVARALHGEWRRHLRHAQPLAVLALAIDRLPALRSSQGPATCDAVIAEVALQLRLLLRAADVVGHVGDGLFLVLMRNTPLAVAQRWARAVQGAIAGDTGLHPESAERLTLSAGVALATAGCTEAGLLAEAQALCRAAQAAGGNRLLPAPLEATAAPAAPVPAAR